MTWTRSGDRWASRTVVLDNGSTRVLSLSDGAGSRSQRALWPVVLAVTITDGSRRSSALQDDVVSALEGGRRAFVALVEHNPSDGQRVFYVYTSDHDELVARVEAFGRAHRSLEVVISSPLPDPAWKLLDVYRSKWPW